jgi:uncharacterized membrane protein YhaH (DUF805 family)
MKNWLVYGMVSGVMAISLMVLNITLIPSGHSLWLGYLVMLVGLSFIFVGVKRYRDVNCGGVIRFLHAFALGAAIALVAGVIYSIGWEIYLALSGSDMMADYSASTLARMREQGASAAAIAAKQEELRQLIQQYHNPLLRVPMTFLEIFPVGLVVALISAALLRNARLLPARSA